MRALLIFLTLLLLCQSAEAQRRIDDFRSGVFANLGTCDATNDGERFRVTDAADATCAAGGGATACTVACQDGAWVKLGSGSGVALAADGEVDAAKAVNAADPRLQSSFGLLIEAPSVLDDAALFSIASRAATITEVYCVTDAGTVDLNLEVRDRTTPDTAGTSVLSVDVTCDSDGALGTIASGAVTTDDILLWRISDVAGANRLNAMAR